MPRPKAPEAALVVSNPTPVEEVPEWRRKLAEIRSGAANSLQLEEVGKVDTSHDNRLPSLTKEVMRLGDVSEETAKELAELIDVVYGDSDEMPEAKITVEEYFKLQIKQAKIMLEFNKSLKLF